MSWLGVALLVAAAIGGWRGVARWRLAGPDTDPVPSGPLALPWGSAAMVVGGTSGAAALAARADGSAWWIVACVATIGLVLSPALAQIARTAAIVLEAERQLARHDGARSGHGSAHTAVGPLEGRLLRAARVAGEQGLTVLAGELWDLGRRARRAEQTAKERAGGDTLPSARADRLRATLSAVRARPTRLFSDNSSMPAGWGPGRRRAWRPIAERLDAVRAIHTYQIEWIALYATLWLRPVALLSLPILPSALTAGVRPLDGEPVVDVVWLAAVAAAAATALASPWLVPEVERKDVERIPVCRSLLAIEGALWAALIAACPSWLAWTFGSGPFTWAERPQWSTRRAVAIAVPATAGLALSLVIRGPSPSHVLAECAAAALAVALMASSYGLMVPLVIDRLLLAERRGRAAERTLERELSAAALRELDQVVAAARERIELAGMRGPAAGEVALQPAPPTDGRRRLWPRVRTVEQILTDAATPLVPGRREPGARVTLRSPQFEPSGLGSIAVRRGHRAQLERAWKAVIGEADRHGIGEIAVRVARVDGWLELTVSNEPDPDDPPGGSSAGLQIIRDELAKLPDGHLPRPPRPEQRRRDGRPAEVWVTAARCRATVLEGDP